MSFYHSDTEDDHNLVDSTNDHVLEVSPEALSKVNFQIGFQIATSGFATLIKNAEISFQGNGLLNCSFRFQSTSDPENGPTKLMMALYESQQNI